MSVKLPQKITYWLPTGDNGTGGKTWASGVVVPARITVIAAEQVFDSEGKAVMANKVVYANIPLPIGAYLVEGENKNIAAPTSGSQMVVMLSSNPTMTSLSRMLL